MPERLAQLSSFNQLALCFAPSELGLTDVGLAVSFEGVIVQCAELQLLRSNRRLQARLHAVCCIAIHPRLRLH